VGAGWTGVGRGGWVACLLGGGGTLDAEGAIGWANSLITETQSY
jgi:hypothetical protein